MRLSLSDFSERWEHSFPQEQAQARTQAQEDPKATGSLIVCITVLQRELKR